jgi:hypothetical protein
VIYCIKRGTWNTPNLLLGIDKISDKQKNRENPAFATAINEDVRENLTQEAKRINPTPSDADIQKAVDAIMKGKSVDNINANDPM